MTPTDADDPIPPTPGGYDVVSRLFHWTVVLLIGVTVPVGIAMTSEGFDSIGNELYVTHKGIGVILLVVVLARLAWRLVRPAPAMPAAIPAGERTMAKAGHRLLYLLLIGMAVTGYLRTAGGGYPVEILDALGIDPLVGELAYADTLSVIHKFGAWLTVSVIAVHVAMVVQHSVFGEARVIRRMWPPFTSKGPDSARGESEG